MAIDLGNTIDRSRLWKAVKSSRDALDLWDRNRTTMLVDYGGTLYTPYRGMGPLRYVNKLQTTARIYQMALAFNNPQAKVDSFNQKLWPFCRKYETNINKVAANINLNITFQEAVLDAFFLMGILKVRMADAGEREVAPNLWLDPGKPWVDRVSHSDCILDMPGRSLRSMRFYGDRYRASFNAVRNRDDYDWKVLSKMSPSSKLNLNASGERGDSIATGNSIDDDELEPMCWLMDLYLPRERKFVTFAADQDNLPPLKVQDWDGSDQGPYNFLAFGYMPDNVMPTSPAENLVLLDRLMNRLFDKLADQADRQKNTVGFAAGKEEEALRGMNAEDGEFWNAGIDPKSNFVPVNFPGVDANTNAFFLATQEVYNVQSGNERSLAGLGEEAGTLGQEQQIAAHAGGLVGFMKGQVNAVAAEVLREIGCLMWDDDALEVDSSMEAENTGYHVDTPWRPGQREGLKDHYDFSVDPNSMAYRPPEADIQTVNQFAQAYLQMLPAIQAGIFDGQEYARFYAKKTNTPEILRFVKQFDIEAQGQADNHQATKSPVTERNVTRTSSNTGPRGQGAQAVLGQAMQANSHQGAMVGGGR